MSLSEVLRKRRSELGYTLLEIADKMGVSEATVQRWESGNIKSLRQGRISQLAEILKVSPAALMGWEDNTAPNSPSSLFSDSGENIIQTAKIALFGGADHVTDEMWQEVVNFAKYIEAREADKNRNV